MYSGTRYKIHVRIEDDPGMAGMVLLHKCLPRAGVPGTKIEELVGFGTSKIASQVS